MTVLLSPFANCFVCVYGVVGSFRLYLVRVADRPLFERAVLWPLKRENVLTFRWFSLRVLNVAPWIIWMNWIVRCCVSPILVGWYFINGWYDMYCGFFVVAVNLSVHVWLIRVILISFKKKLMYFYFLNTMIFICWILCR